MIEVHDEIKERVCCDCKGYGGSCQDHCDAYQIALLCDELFGVEFWEKWDGIMPKKTSKLLRGLKGLKMLKELALAVSVGEVK